MKYTILDEEDDDTDPFIESDADFDAIDDTLEN